MSAELTLEFAPIALPAKGVLIVFCEEGLKFGAAAAELLEAGRRPDRARRGGRALQGQERRGPGYRGARRASRCRGWSWSGSGKAGDLKSQGLVKLGGVAMGKVPSREEDVTIVADLPGGMKPERAADLALGVRLRAYSFDRYKTKRKEGEEPPKQVTVTIAVSSVGAVQKAFVPRDAVADGVLLARDLVNEPANVLFPEEFARRTSQLKKLGVDVEMLDVAAMKKLGMNALLGVGQGSVHESRMVIMRWNGGKSDAKPIAFIGKGVCFDTGGISIKPASGMEDMKGDMAGAACVVGLMQALAERKAKVNAVGAIGAGRERGRRQGAAAGRYRHDHVGADDRDHQHRCRRPARAGRRAALRQQALQTQIHGRSGDA